MRDDAREWRGDFCVIEQNLIVFAFCLRGGQQALRGLPIRFRGFDLSGRLKCLALGIVYFLLRDQGRFGLGDAAQPLELQLHNPVLSFDPAQFVFGVRNLIGGVPDRRIVLLQLGLQLGDFQRGERLVCLHAAPVVHVQFFHITGLFRVDLDFLKRNQFG